ncbi:MAG: tetratricopeptide repeat protein, partial [Gemmatimonadota bacterium]
MSLDGETLWRRVRDARLTRVLVVYLSASFVVLQVVDIFTDQLGLPDWFFPGAVVLLAIGLPILVTTALVQGATNRSGGRHLVNVPPSDDDIVLGDDDRPAGFARRWFTWRRALLGGALAFAVLGVAVTGYMGLRALGIGPGASLVAAGVLEDRGQLLVGDFENHTSDALLGAVVTEAIRVDLAQSPVVRVVGRNAVQRTLERMRRPADVVLDAELAREVALRDGIGAVLTGDIGAAGEGFVLSVELVQPGSGEVLAAYRETASDSTAIVDAIDELSGRLRERIGESLKSIRADDPLEQVTTPSLEALRKYSQAQQVMDRDGDASRGVALLQEAVEIDTAFAMAWRKLGTVLSNVREERARSVEALKRAYAHRERLSDRERYLTISSYHNIVTDDDEKSVQALRTLLDLHPDDSWALNNLGLEYQERGAYAEAEELYLRAAEVDPQAVPAWTNLIEVRAALGRWEAAGEALQRFAAVAPDHPVMHEMGFVLALAREEFAQAEARLQELAGADPHDLLTRSRLAESRAALALWRGHAAEAEHQLREAIAVYEQRGLESEALRRAVWIADDDVRVEQDTAAALRKLEPALQRYPLAGMAPLDRPYGQLAALYAHAGRPDRS